MLIILRKSNQFPDGTITNRGGKKFKKQKGGWFPLKDGKTPEELKQAEKEKKNILTIKGSSDILDGLKRVSTEDIYIDDLDDDRQLMNKLTKYKLITWNHVGKDEYKAVLTDSGKRALDSGHAVKNRTDVITFTELVDDWNNKLDDEDFLYNLQSQVKGKK